MPEMTSLWHSLQSNLICHCEKIWFSNRCSSCQWDKHIIICKDLWMNTRIILHICLIYRTDLCPVLGTVIQFLGDIMLMSVFMCSWTYMTTLLIISFFTGTKLDLRDDRQCLSELAAKGLSPIKREQGQKLATKVHARKYLECSALTQQGLKRVSNQSVDEVKTDPLYDVVCQLCKL